MNLNIIGAKNLFTGRKVLAGTYQLTNSFLYLFLNSRYAAGLYPLKTSRKHRLIFCFNEITSIRKKKKNIRKLAGFFAIQNL